jgi:hypothetical protein
MLQRAARAVRVARARRDFIAFAEYVLRDESTGAPIQLCDMHREWSRLLNAHDQLQLLCHVESGKSALISVGWTLWQLGRNPNLRIALVSNTQAQSEKILRSISRLIETSQPLKEVFPGLKRSEPWNQTAIAVERSTVSRDASVIASGLHGNILGSRFDLVCIDDVLDFESARTEGGRTIATEWIQSTVFSRRTARAQTIVVGTPWHVEDFHHRLESQGWLSRRFSVEDANGAPRWPERWSPERVARARLALGPAQSARQLDVQCRGDDASVFDSAWLELALRRGAEALALKLQLNPRGEPYWLSGATPPAKVITALDPSVGRTNRSDLSALSTIFVRSDGSREVLEMQSGRWPAPEILRRIESVHERLHPSKIIVEGNAAQMFLVQLARQSGSRLPVEPFVTGKNQKSMAWLAQRLGAEMSAGRWLIPSHAGAPATPELRALLRDLQNFTPRDHTPDRLASLLLCCTALERPTAKVEWITIPGLGGVR